MNIHNEIIREVPEGIGNLNEVVASISSPVDKGLKTKTYCVV